MSATRGGPTPLDLRLAEIEALEPHRHACEVKHVAGWNPQRRTAFLEGIEKKRGALAARKFAADVSAYLADNFGNGRRHPPPPSPLRRPGEGRA